MIICLSKPYFHKRLNYTLEKIHGKYVKEFLLVSLELKCQLILTSNEVALAH